MATGAIATNRSVDNRQTRRQPIAKRVVEWTSDASGDVDQPLGKIVGSIIGILTVPGTAGDQPTDLYDVTVEDEEGYDVLETVGVDRSNVNTEKALVLDELTIGSNPYGAHPAVCGEMTFKVAGAGATKKGTCIIYFR